MDKNKLMETDLYDLFGVTITASEQNIKTAYRKKALKCHPDKNPDNPDAVRLFLELSTALEILLDSASRASYDKIYNGKKAAKVRHQELDSRRKKFKEDLEAREKKAQQEDGGGAKRKYKSEKERLAAEIERLRKEGSKDLLNEMESVRRQVFQEQQRMATKLSGCFDDLEGCEYKLKVKWSCDETDTESGGYDHDKLTKIFSKYGDIACIVISRKKNNYAIIEFEKASAAVNAQKLEVGFPTNPLKVSYVAEPPRLPHEPSPGFDFTNSVRTPASTTATTMQQQPTTDKSSGGLFPSFAQLNSKKSNNDAKRSHVDNQGNDDNDFEAMVFARMRQAEEEKQTKNLAT